MRDFCFNGTKHIACILTSQLIKDYNISFVVSFKKGETVFVDENHQFSRDQIHSTDLQNGKILFVNNYEPDGYFALFYTIGDYSTFPSSDFDLIEEELEFFDSESVKEAISVIESATKASDRSKAVFNLFYTIESKRLTDET